MCPRSGRHRGGSAVEAGEVGTWRERSTFSTGVLAYAAILAVAALACASAPRPPPATAPAPVQAPAPPPAAPAPRAPYAPETGLLCEVEPAEAQIAVDGQPYGTVAELALRGGELALAPGIYQVSLRAPGHATWRAEVAVRTGTEAIRVKLTRNP